MREYAATSGCRMRYLRECSTTPGRADCGRCDTCAGAAVRRRACPLPRSPPRRTFLGRPGVQIAPKKLWPTGLDAVGVPLKGRIAPAEQALPGRAVGRLSDLGWGGRLRGLVGPEAPDAPVPDDVRGGGGRGAEGVGARRRPVAAPPGRRWSRRAPAPARSWSARSPSGSPPWAGCRCSAGSSRPDRPAPAGPRGNSAQRVRALHDAFAVPATSWPTRCAGLAGPVLLVDDLVDSGWTMTHGGPAAAPRRRAGRAAAGPRRRRLMQGPRSASVLEGYRYPRGRPNGASAATVARAVDAARRAARVRPAAPCGDT